MTSLPPIMNNAAAAGTSTGTSTSSPSNGLLSPTDFMTLLVGQLKNQDPTAPMDPNQFMNQLVGFNSLETQLGMKQDLDTLSAAISGTGGTGTGTGTGTGSGSTGNTGTTGLPSSKI
jgi:flagellar basal-body rod modification protein FlgD